MGIVIIVIFFSQIPLGMLTKRKSNHAAHTNVEMQTGPLQRIRSGNMMVRSHSFIAYFMVALAIVNASLGFVLAKSPSYIKIWVPIAVGVQLIWIGVIGIRWMWRKQVKDAKEDLAVTWESDSASHSQGQEFQMDHFGQNTGAGYQGQQYSNVAVPNSYR